MKKWIVLWLLVLFFPLNASANPWTKQPGKFSVQAGIYGIYSEANFALNAFDGDYYSITSYLEAEFGLPWGFGIKVHLPFVSAWHTNSTTTHQALGMGDSFVKLQWTPRELEKRIGMPLTLHIDAKIPLYDVDTWRSDPTLVQRGVANEFPLIGDGQIDLTFALSVGKYWEVGDWIPFVSVMAGYQYRSPWFIGNGFGQGVTFLSGAYFRVRGGAEWKRFAFIIGLEGNVPVGTETRGITEGQLMLETTISLTLGAGFSIFASGYTGLWAVNTGVPYLASLGIIFEN